MKKPIRKKKKQPAKSRKKRQPKRVTLFTAYRHRDGLPFVVKVPKGPTFGNRVLASAIADVHKWLLNNGCLRI